ILSGFDPSTQTYIVFSTQLIKITGPSTSPCQTDSIGSLPVKRLFFQCDWIDNIIPICIGYTQSRLLCSVPNGSSTAVNDNIYRDGKFIYCSPFEYGNCISISSDTIEEYDGGYSSNPIARHRTRLSGYHPFPIGYSSGTYTVDELSRISDIEIFSFTDGTAGQVKFVGAFSRCASCRPTI